MTVIAFTDLDDTLFQSPRKCPDLSNHTVAAKLPNGEVGAYSTPQQQVLIALLGESTVIPVTGRRTDSLSRVVMDFEGYKVASHGAIVLTAQNSIHPEWHVILTEEEPLWCKKMNQLAIELDQFVAKNTLDLRVRVVQDYGFACYVCVKGLSSDLQLLQACHADNIPSEGFILHVNERNLAFMPPYASKRRAVNFLKKILISNSTNHITFLGLGDSNSDTGFMSECDFQIIPSDSQIAGKLE